MVESDFVIDVKSRIAQHAELGGTIVSLDFFDTMVVRSVMEPVNVFGAMARQPEVLSFLRTSLHVDFTQARVRAEAEARRISVHDEVTLEEIWLQLLGFGSASAKVDRFIELEIATELTHIAKAPWCDEVLAAVHRAGLQLIVVSDSYLPSSFFSAALKRVGAESGGIFVSSELRATKHSGAIWPKVLRALSASPQGVLHIGDNAHSDVASPRRYGIAAQELRTWTCNQDPVDVADDAIYPTSRLLQHWRIENWTDRQPLTHYALGFSVGATLLLGYVEWARRLSTGRGMVFLPREGYLLREIMMAVDIGAPSSVLPISRGVVQRQEVLEEPSTARIEGLVPSDVVVEPGVVLRSLFASASPAEMRSILERFSSEVTTHRFCARSDLVAFLLARGMQVLMDSAERERSVLAEIIRSLELGDGYVLLDSGWRGTTQGFLERFSREQGLPAPSCGLYLGTHDSTFERPAGMGPAFGFLSSPSDDPTHKAVLRGAIDILEEWLGTDHVGSVIGYSQAPVSEPILGLHEKTTWRDELQLGLRRGVQSLLARDEVPTKAESRAALQRFFGFPTDEFVRLCEDIQHATDSGHNVYNGVVAIPEEGDAFYVRGLLHTGFFLGKVRRMKLDGRMQDADFYSDVREVVSRVYSAKHADYILR